MPSSRIDHESGVVTVTTPGAGYEPGQRFFVMGSAATLGLGYSDWVLRLLDPLPPWNGRQDAPNHDPAQAQLLEQLRSGEVHPSLVDEPSAQAA